MADGGRLWAADELMLLLSWCWAKWFRYMSIFTSASHALMLMQLMASNWCHGWCSWCSNPMKSYENLTGSHRFHPITSGRIWWNPMGPWDFLIKPHHTHRTYPITSDRILSKWKDMKGKWMEMKGKRKEMKGTWIEMKGKWIEMKGKRKEMKGKWMEMKGQWMKTKGKWMDMNSC